MVVGRDARRLVCENSNEFSQSANLVDVQRLQPNSHFAEEMSGCKPLLKWTFALCEFANCEFAFPIPPITSQNHAGQQDLWMPRSLCDGRFLLRFAGYELGVQSNSSQGPSSLSRMYKNLSSLRL